MIRLTGGEWNGRGVETPAHSRTRPTAARLRQALFNSLQARIPGARVLDLFAGSGALAFEALSRGAAFALAIEQDAATAKLIEKNARTLGAADRLRVRAEEVERFLREGSKEAPFDLIFIDPPYSLGYESKLLAHEGVWERLLVPDGCLCLEWSPLKAGVKKEQKEASILPDRVGCLVKTREKNYGDTVLTTYQRLT